MGDGQDSGPGTFSQSPRAAEHAKMDSLPQEIAVFGFLHPSQASLEAEPPQSYQPPLQHLGSQLSDKHVDSDT